MHRPQLHTFVLAHLIEETLLFELLDGVPPEEKDQALATIVSLVTLACIQKVYNSIVETQIRQQYLSDVTALLSRSMDKSIFFDRYPGSEQLMQEQAQRTLLSLHTKNK